MAANKSEYKEISSQKAGRPWLGLPGELAWHLSLCLYEVVSLGRFRWWWKMHAALRREFRSLKPDRLVQGANGPPSLSYGETPALSMVRVLERCQVAPTAVIVDLGCGRGIPLLTAACLGYGARGLDFFGEYVDGCRRVAEALGLDVEVCQGDFLDCEWPQGDVYFLSSTAFAWEVREKLLERMRALPAGVRIVTSDWLLPFRLQSQMVLPVTWGTAYFSIYVKDDP